MKTNFIKFLGDINEESINGGSFVERESKLIRAVSEEDKGNYYLCIIENSMFTVRIYLTTECIINRFSIELDEKTGFMNKVVSYPDNDFGIYMPLKEAVDNRTVFEFDLEDVNLGTLPIGRKVMFRFTIEDSEGSRFNENEITYLENYDHDKSKMYFSGGRSFIMEDPIGFWSVIIKALPEIEEDKKAF